MKPWSRGCVSSCPPCCPPPPPPASGWRAHSRACSQLPTPLPHQLLPWILTSHRQLTHAGRPLALSPVLGSLTAALDSCAGSHIASTDREDYEPSSCLHSPRPAFSQSLQQHLLTTSQVGPANKPDTCGVTFAAPYTSRAILHKLPKLPYL